MSVDNTTFLCPQCRKPGPFYHLIEAIQRIEVVFDVNALNGYKIVDDAIAEEVDASSAGFQCFNCAARFLHPLTVPAGETGLAKPNA